MSPPLFELPIHFDNRRYASQQERQLRRLAKGGDGVAYRRTWYGMELIGSEEDLLSALIEIAGIFRAERMRPRYAGD